MVFISPKFNMLDICMKTGFIKTAIIYNKEGHKIVSSEGCFLRKLLLWETFFLPKIVRTNKPPHVEYINPNGWFIFSTLFLLKKQTNQRKIKEDRYKIERYSRKMRQINFLYDSCFVYNQQHNVAIIFKNSNLNSSYDLTRINPHWHGVGTFIPMYFLDWIFSAELLSKLSKLFGGKNWHTSG